MLEIAQFGAGRIGQIHAASIAAMKDVRLRYLVDVNADAAHKLAARYGTRVVDEHDALADREVGAVLIASSTDTHARLAIAAARAGKAIFCEKPIDLSLLKVDACLQEVEKAGVPMFVGFNRRFDPSFSALKARLDAGEIGAVEQVVISSRDPGPPPLSYIKVSGGMFRDMTIHDFDMARFILDDEVVEVLACGASLVDPAIGRAGDIDTAVVTLRFARGALGCIDNVRRAVYGYDQRVEVLGARGALVATHAAPTTVSRWDAAGLVGDRPHAFFLERYAEAYVAEMRAFIDCVRTRRMPPVGGADGLQALRIALAARRSLQEGRPVAVDGALAGGSTGKDGGTAAGPGHA